MAVFVSAILTELPGNFESRSRNQTRRQWGKTAKPQMAYLKRKEKEYKTLKWNKNFNKSRLLPYVLGHPVILPALHYQHHLSEIRANPLLEVWGFSNS